VTRAKRVTVSLLVGGGAAVVEWMFVFNFVPLGPGALGDALRLAVTILAAPGLIAAVAVAANAHTYSPAVVIGASLAFYALLTYGILAIRERRRSRT